MNESERTLVALCEEAVDITKEKALERSVFSGWFQVNEVIDMALRLELKKPLVHLIRQYDWRGEVIATATRYGLRTAIAQVLKRPLPEYLPDVRMRSHMTQQLAGGWYWFPTLKCDADWFDQLAHGHAEIARRNDFNATIAFAVRDLLRLHGGDLRDVPVERVKEVIQECGRAAA